METEASHFVFHGRKKIRKIYVFTPGLFGAFDSEPAWDIFSLSLVHLGIYELGTNGSKNALMARLKTNSGVVYLW